MHSNSRRGNQEGFSLLEMIITMTVMLIVTSAIVSLVNSSIKIATATYELTDAQESLRTAQEFINRDLMSAGDGLRNMANIPVTKTFVQNYLAITPVVDPAPLPATVTNLGVLTTDNDVPANSIVFGQNPAVATNPLVYVRSSPVLTDRQTILQIDSDFSPIALLAPAINGATASTITIADADRTRFTAGEIYFLTSSVGGTFGTVTAVTDIAGANSTLTFAQGAANGDNFGLNVTGAGGRINTISAGGTLATSLQRMRIIHYYINSDGMLMRRVFGVKGAGFRESAIAEHVVSVQFLYSLSPDTNGNIVQPVTTLTTPEQRIAVRQVEVTVTVETPHALQQGLRQNMSMTTSTTMRNMQFRQALQPKATL